LRLVVNRIQAVLPVASAALWTMDAERKKLVMSNSVPDHDPVNDKLAGDCRASAEISIGRVAGKNGEIHPAAAIPLMRAESVYGVLQLIFDERFQVRTPGTRDILENLCARISPLILSSLAFERSRENALTDPTTDLPNGRAFYLVLENQLAEASRQEGERPLTILAMDVKGFDEINRRFGHAAGDAVLDHVAGTIKDSLRRMDFLARVSDDEFLAILPAAYSCVAAEIVERIRTSFSAELFKVNDSQSVMIELNFGWAEFGADGEASHDIVHAAEVRKSQAKHTGPQNVLTFAPRSLVSRPDDHLS
jgi:diguanylate cyclase (GGDEF)-like protein